MYMVGLLKLELDENRPVTFLIRGLKTNLFSYLKFLITYYVWVILAGQIKYPKGRDSVCEQ